MLGPHFYFDLIRLPRKGWSTFFRCLYLGILLLGLAVMYESNRHTIHNAGDYARFAHSFAYTLIVLQDILVLFLLPVYVASAIAEERENQTIEALFISPLTDQQIVLGKFGGRLLHLGAVILAGVPLLAFMHMWGNVPLAMLLYHFMNTLLLAMTAYSLCILVSTNSQAVFQAVTSSYPFVLILGLAGDLVGFGLPWFLGPIFNPSTQEPAYLPSFLIILLSHLGLTKVFLVQAMTQMQQLRYLETRPLRKKTSSFALADDKPKPVHTHKGRLRGSHIHPLALPIREPALFWKECLKDGTYWSLTFPWALVFLLLVGGTGSFFHILLPSSEEGRYFVNDLRSTISSFTFSAYFISLAAFLLVVLFQTTMSVAGEREQNTLECLLLLPVTRREILFLKWFGPLWRNWPILIICYLGILLGLSSSIFSPGTGLFLAFLPWPFLLMSSFLALWLSVVCRRVLFANIVLVGFLLMLLVSHIIGASFLKGLFPAYAYLMFEANPHEFSEMSFGHGLLLVLVEQTAFLLLGAALALAAFVQFQAKDYQGKM